MKAENVTSRHDPEFFEAMSTATAAWSRFYDADIELEQHTVRRTLRARNRALKLAEAAQQAVNALAEAKGYIT